MIVRRLFILSLLCVPAVALAQRATLQRPAPIRGGVFEASGVVPVPASSGVLFVDDNSARHVFWMEFGQDGLQAGPAVAVPLGLFADDLEDITSDGTWFYAVASQSKPASVASNGLVRFAFDPRTRRASNVSGVMDLSGFLRRRVPDLAARSGRGASGLNIEGLAWEASTKRLLLGLRAPMIGSDALVVALTLPAGATGFDRAVLDSADVSVLRLATAGLGIRGLGYDAAANRVLALVGSSGEPVGRTVPFRLLSWDTSSSSAPAVVASFPASLKPEGVTRMTMGGRSRTLVVSDSGRYLFLD